MKIRPHSIRLFPKGLGADEYLVTGIASLCDWVVLTDYVEPKYCLRGDLGSQPRTVFLSLRSRMGAINNFYYEVLPHINSRFVLITGSSDVTIPTQTDRRWPAFDAAEIALICKIRDDPRVIHWFAENLDASHDKMSPIPTGCLPSNRSAVYIKLPGDYLALSRRPMKALCCHRTRDGDQWEQRRIVTRQCQEGLKSLATTVTEEVGAAEFNRMATDHPFVLCVEGGGLDPSPKAWEALIHGSVPIIRSSTVELGYEALPVAKVDDWASPFLSLTQMRLWIEEFEHFFCDLSARMQVGRNLSLWSVWYRIQQKAVPH